MTLRYLGFKFVIFYRSSSQFQTMPIPPEGYVVLPTSIPHTDLSNELNKWKTAKPSLPDQDGNFNIYVTEEEWNTYLDNLTFSTR
jgi:hypothetical protein